MHVRIICDGVTDYLCAIVRHAKCNGTDWPAVPLAMLLL